MKTTYRVQQIRSKRATEREKLEPRTIEKVIGDFDSLEAAKEAYSEIKTGMEVDKELIELDTDKIIETTY